jgi:hypothetical protein
MASEPPQHHRFNDDLLLDQSDEARTKTAYPGIFHVLCNPELQDLFGSYDTPANKAKRQGRGLGFMSIILVSVALVLSLIETFFPAGEAGTSFWDRRWHVSIAVLSAICGLAGTLVGSIGVLHSRRKRTWLLQRLMTERLRQFHFQMLVCRLDDILSSLAGAHARRKFVASRAEWFSSFKAHFIGKLDSEFERVLNEDGASGMWLHPLPAARSEELPELEPVFAAYRDLRILHQLGYADQKLASGVPGGLRRQRDILSMASIISTGIVCLIQVGVLAMVFFDGPLVNGLNKLLAIMSMMLIFAALAAHAVEQGMQPDREIERYQQYRAALRAIRDRFDAAASQQEKLSVMMAMERLSYDEMRNFLLTNNEARFVM